MDNSKIEVIKAPGYLELFEYGSKFFNNLVATYECPCVENLKENYWVEMYDTITKYNDRHNTPVSNVKIREAINQVTREEKSRAAGDSDIQQTERPPRKCFICVSVDHLINKFQKPSKDNSKQRKNVSSNERGNCASQT